MAHNPQVPQGPDGSPDPAGSTQMFRAFVNDGSAPRPGTVQAPAGPRVGLIVGVIAVIAVVAAAAWFALA